MNREPNPFHAPPDTPAGAETRLAEYRDELDKAAEALAQARNEELEAEEARDEAERRARFSAKCPKVGVRDGVRTTVAFAEAWIKEEAKNEEHAYRLAKVARQAAATHLDKLRKQGAFQQSMVASTRESYRGTNGRYS